MSATVTCHQCGITYVPHNAFRYGGHVCTVGYPPPTVDPPTSTADPKDAPMQVPPQPMVFTPEHLSRRDLMALELFNTFCENSAPLGSREYEARATEAYRQADALIKASGEGIDE